MHNSSADLTQTEISRRNFLKITSIGSTSLLFGCFPNVNKESTLALINGRLIDGTGDRPVSDGVLVIQGSRIIDAGSATSVTIPGNAKMIDVEGGTILPGFINAHVHAAYDSASLKAWAREGVTTVRDLSAFVPYSPQLFNTRDALNADSNCARLVAAGWFINVEGGYPEVYWDCPMISVNSPESARQAVTELIDAGADVIKTAMESGSAFKYQWPLLPPETAKALVDAAHERGKLVSAHVTDSRDLGRALDAGVDEIAHMVVDQHYLSDTLIERMVAGGIRWIPTLELWQGISRNYHLTYEEAAINNLARFAAAGGEIALGTDYAGAPNFDFNLGMPMNEIDCMQKAGISPMQIIVAATRNGARACDLIKEIGTLEKGKLADVLVVKGNPLDNLNALTETQLVLKKGQAIQPKA